MKKKCVAIALSLGIVLAGCGKADPVVEIPVTPQEEGLEQEAEVVPEEAPVEPVEEVHEPAQIELTFPNFCLFDFEGEQGSIEKITYMANDYLGDGEPVEKSAYVYLPAGYDESKQYDVIYLMHGIGGDENEWGLNKASTSRVKKILDNLIGYGDIDPVIVVTPNGKAFGLSGVSGNDLFYQFGYELRNDLIPYIEGHYATYAEYSEEGYDLTATRTHRAMAGLSMGGMQTINIGICECLDLFSWFGAFSAAPTSYEATKVGFSIDNAEYDVDFFYNICGLDDNIAYASASAAAKNLPLFSERMVDGENFMWQEKKGGHDFNIWYLGFYNFAQIAFNGLNSVPIGESEDNTMAVNTNGYTLDDVEKITELAQSLKTRGDSNPIMTQDFGADPYVLVYGDTLYIYMTADTLEYDANGEVTENTYSHINTIHVVSTKDMKNFTDHGEIPVAGENGIAKWARNSWAPAVACKNIDGQDKFFLYFADNGGGIGVVCADSPVGPFVDPLGHGLITRDVPTCAEVLWLFDPAVLVDDDGSAYIYFGGGVPEGMAAHPGTGRVAKLGDDMISIDGTPVPIDAPYMFEDSGIHKYNDTYYYTYCTNFSVDSAGTAEYGFVNGQIAYMTSDSPMGPFTFQGKILDNPGKLCGLSSNNHHAIFSFNDTYYIAYHSRMLEKNMGVEHGYRATFINEVSFDEDGKIKLITQTTAGPDQLINVNPYEVNSAVCVTKMGGTNAVPKNEDIAYGSMLLGEIETGDFVEITGVDFGDEGAKTLTVQAHVPDDQVGAIYVRVDYLNGSDMGSLLLYPSGGDGLYTYTVELDQPITGVHYLYFVFAGKGYTIDSWQFS